jgi:hypothetical protein
MTRPPPRAGLMVGVSAESGFSGFRRDDGCRDGGRP